MPPIRASASGFGARPLRTRGARGSTSRRGPGRSPRAPGSPAARASSAARPRSTPEPSRTPRMFTAASTTIAPTATRLRAPGRRGERGSPHSVARPTATAAVMPGSVTSIDSQPKRKATRGPVGFLQVDVGPAGLRVPRRQCAEAERAAGRAGPDRQPDDEQPERRAQRLRHARPSSGRSPRR